MKSYRTQPSAARVITNTLKRQDRARRRRALIGEVVFLGKWIGSGAVCWLAALGALSMVKG